MMGEDVFDRRFVRRCGIGSCKSVGTELKKRKRALLLRQSCSSWSHELTPAPADISRFSASAREVETGNTNDICSLSLLFLEHRTAEIFIDVAAFNAIIVQLSVRRSEDRLQELSTLITQGTK